MFKKGYKIEFINPDSDTWQIFLYNKADFDDTATSTIYTDVEGGGDPLHLASDNNEENKFAPIRATKATIQILATKTINLSTFVLDADDDQWYVEIYKNTNTIIFCGHLVLNDCNQEFLDDEYCTITLTATDGLGLLRDVPLTDENGNYPRRSETGDKFKLIELISLALRKTGLELEINVINNLIEQWFIPTNFDVHPAYDNIYEWIKSFEGDEIGKCIDCYTVLERILGQECYLCQAYGTWWIRRIDEMQRLDDAAFLETYDYDGTYLGRYTTTKWDYSLSIGEGNIMGLLAPAALVSVDRRHGEVKETFTYEYPKEIIDNIDFSRGALTQDLGNEKQYHFDDWTTEAGPLLMTTGYVAVTAVPYIRRIFDTGYEKERYVVMPPYGGYYWIRPNNFLPVLQKDKFTISFDAKITVNPVVHRPPQLLDFFFGIILRADNGQVWAWARNVNNGGKIYWQQITTNPSIPDPALFQFHEGDFDFTQWKNFSFEPDAVPLDGEIEIRFYARGETHYQNLRFDYQPYINGSYQKYIGQHNLVKQAGTLAAKIDAQVYMSDSPRKLFKGALFKKNYGLVYTGNIVFQALKTIKLTGVNKTADIIVGDRLRVPFATLNYGIYEVTAVTFNGTDTVITTNETVINETINATIFKQTNKFVLAEKWYDGAVGAIRFSPTPDSYHPLGHLQAYSVWNQYNRDMRLFDASVSATDDVNKVPSPIYTYLFTDHSPHTYGKQFHLLHFDIDCYQSQWRGFFAEVFDDQIGHRYSDPLEFKYIEQR